MSIIESVKVNTHYTRSINLERDAGSVEVIRSYIPTSRALSLFARVAEGFSSGQRPRAWSVIGPYGSGKSSSQSFLSQLMSSPDSDLFKEAINNLKSASHDLAKSFTRHTRGSKGYLRVLVTGAPEPMSRRILQGLLAAAIEFWTSPGPKPKVFGDIAEACDDPDLVSSNVVGLVKELNEKLANHGCKGIYLVIDELGKFLEFEARHYGTNDIYLLQSLAEMACGAGDSKLFLFVLLHQSFEQYAKGLGETLKNEWSKVQGRFEDVPFLESPEQVLRVVGSAFEHSFKKVEQENIYAQIAKNADVLQSESAIVGVSDQEHIRSILARCYPLHPVSALLLPLLCQKVAQNERTLFSYLGSHEEFGLQDMLTKLSCVGEWVLPHHIYDYFISNQPAALGDYTTHRRWAEVVTALDRLGDAPEEEVLALKTVGILNIVGIKGGFKASKPILELCFPSKAAASKALKSLQEKSIVTYRKFSSEYRVWQGSDFDLELAVREELDALGEFSLSEVLNSEKSLLPIAARRHTIQSGALRYFAPLFVDAQTYRRTELRHVDPRVIIFLASAKDDEALFYESVQSAFSMLDVVALCRNGQRLREATAEVLALKQVEERRQELNTDPVVKREFDDRYAAAQRAQHELINSLIEKPQEMQWFHQSVDLDVVSKRSYQESLSRVLEKVYRQCPVIHNELINRDYPSSQANAARNKLISAMLNHSDKVDLGIEKYPPEKAIYRSLLRETGIHNRDTLVFQVPPKNSTISGVWEKIDKFLEGSEREPRSFADLNQGLMSPPYGVKAGILPILYVAVYIVYQHELAVYEEGKYRPFFTDEMIERFVKRPDIFTVQRFKIEGLRASIYEEYSKLVDTGAGGKKNVVQLVRPLATWIASLEDYTLKTKSGLLSDKAKKVRDAFEFSKSPESLLFQDIPKSLGYSLDDGKETIEGLASSLQACLSELKNTYPNLLQHHIQLLLSAFGMEKGLSLTELRENCIGRYSGLDQHTVDIDGLNAFIKRLTRRDLDDQAWLENVLMFLGQKPSTKWSDADKNLADVRLSDFSKRILDLELLRLHYDATAKNVDGEFDVYLIKSLKKGGSAIEGFATVDKATSKIVGEIGSKMEDVFSEYGKNPSIQLAALAEFVDKFLHKYRDEESSKRQRPQLKLKGVRRG